MNPSPLKIDLLICRTLTYLYEDCSTWSTGVRFCAKRRGISCCHALNLWNCLQVSKQWFRISAHHLWRRYASFQDLISLISGDEQQIGLMRPSQVARWEFYSKFITNLELSQFESTKTNIFPVLELAVYLKGKALLPCLTSLEMGERWTEVPGSQLVMFHLIAPSTTELELVFSPPQSYQLLYNFMALSCRGTALKRLEIRFCYSWSMNDPRLPNDRVAPLTIDSFYPMLGELTSLECLFLEPELVTRELLDVVGSLPKLKNVYLGDSIYTRSNVMSLDLAPHESRKKALFTETTSLTMKADIPIVETLLKTFFSTSPIEFFHIVTQMQTNGGEDVSFLRHLPSRTLINLRIDFMKSGIQQLSLNSLRQAKDLTELFSICIVQAEYLVITDYTEFGELLDRWINLRYLNLHRFFPYQPRQPVVLPGGSTPEQFARLPQQGIDLSCITFFVEHLPNLRGLVLSVLACDTSPLALTTTTCTLKYLETFQLEDSFHNWRLPSFNPHEAARYLSAIIPPSTKFDIQPSEFYKSSPDWGAYEVEYNTFIGSFLERVKNYMQVRECEAKRIMASIKIEAP